MRGPAIPTDETGDAAKSGMLEMLQAMVDGDAPPAPVGELVGFDLVEVSEAGP